jgi:phage portal protein BeeE
VLEEGLEAKVLSFPLKDLQFVEQMQWTAADAARVFRVPLSKVGVPTGDSMTYRTVDSDSIDFVTFSMLGWNTLIEASLLHDEDLFPSKPNRGGSMFAQFNVRALFKADLKTQGEYYRAATGGKAWMKPSEVRPEVGLRGDTELDVAPAPAPPSPPPPPADAPDITAD